MDKFKWAGRLLLVVLAACAPVAAAQTIGDLRRATQQQPDDVSAWIALGEAYFAVGQFDLAKDTFLEAVAVDYLAGDAHFGLGLAEYERGDFQAALFAFNEVARLYPQRFDGHYNRAVTLARLRTPNEAAQAFRDAIAQADPEATADDKISAYLGLAGQLKIAGRYSGRPSPTETPSTSLRRTPTSPT